MLRPRSVGLGLRLAQGGEGKAGAVGRAQQKTPGLPPPLRVEGQVQAVIEALVAFHPGPLPVFPSSRERRAWVSSAQGSSRVACRCPATPSFNSIQVPVSLPAPDPTFSLFLRFSTLPLSRRLISGQGEAAAKRERRGLLIDPSSLR